MLRGGGGIPKDAPPRWRRIAAAVGCLIPLLAGLVFIAAVVAGAPPEHDVVSAGGRSVSFQYLIQSPTDRLQPVFSPVAPATSLTGARCEAWRQQKGGSCPDDASMATVFWPTLQNVPDRLYVGTTCDSTPHLNIEYTGRSLILHCHSAAPWIHFEPRTLGTNAETFSALVIVPTTQMSTGILSVYEEDRVERWLNDQVTISHLGDVAVNV